MRKFVETPKIPVSVVIYKFLHFKMKLVVWKNQQQVTLLSNIKKNFIFYLTFCYFFLPFTNLFCKLCDIGIGRGDGDEFRDVSELWKWRRNAANI